MKPPNNNEFEGILPVAKPKGISAFHLVRLLRRHLNIQKIGHAGTLDPFATGVMVMLIGRQYTRLSDLFLNNEKEYYGRILLGVSTDTFDCDGKILQASSIVPSEQDICRAIQAFQGEIDQIPPMFSAKKVNGKKLYELARKGTIIERKAAKVHVAMETLSYDYPYLEVKVVCSKGTYIRSLANDLGVHLGCGAHLTSLQRTRSGIFTLEDCFDGLHLQSEHLKLEDLKSFLRHQE